MCIISALLFYVQCLYVCQSSMTSQHGDAAIRSLLLHIPSQVSGCSQRVWLVVQISLGRVRGVVLMGVFIIL